MSRLVIDGPDLHVEACPWAWRMNRGETMRSEPACSGTWYPPYAGCDDRPRRPRSIQGQADLHAAGAAGHLGKRRARGGQTSRPVAGGAHPSTAPARRTSATTALAISAVSAFISTIMSAFG